MHYQNLNFDNFLFLKILSKMKFIRYHYLNKKRYFENIIRIKIIKVKIDQVLIIHNCNFMGLDNNNFHFSDFWLIKILANIKYNLLQKIHIKDNSLLHLQNIFTLINNILIYICYIFIISMFQLFHIQYNFLYFFSNKFLLQQ